jgi:hypothetical protein
MIARIWTGTVQRADADVYADYIRETGFVLYPEDERYLVDGRSAVTHYDVVDQVPG